MSELSQPSPQHDSPRPLPYFTPVREPTSIAKFGGAIGISALLVGLAIFLSGCAGFDAAFKFSLIPMILAVTGLLMTIVGGLIGRTAGLEDAHVVASLFLNAAGIVGALMEMAVWRHWMIFAGGV
jgi:hypothetical protein